MRRFNVLTAELRGHEGEPEGYGAAHARVGDAIGGERMAGQVVELAPGQRLCPYHWEAGQEEWLVVLDGEPSVRTPEGETRLRSGDVACFPRGERGAHQVRNDSGAPARVVMLSERRSPNVVVYPDSGKVGVRAEGVRGNFRLGDGVGYWDGEA
jgi:uncharacterized cupin superfamily protein